jgi:hypothetical protein
MQRLADALSAEWDALVSGNHAAPGAAEPLVRAARTLHTVDTTPALSRERRDRIWLGIMAAHASSPRSFSVAPDGNSAFPVLLENPTSISTSSPAHRSRTPFGHWISTQLATAALLLLTLAVGYLAFGRSHWDRTNQEAPGVPALITSQATTAPEASNGAVVLQATIDRLPPLASWAGIERVTLDPGVSLSRGRDQDNGDGPLAYMVESGELTIQANGPTTVTRSGTQTPLAVAPGTNVTLRAGDRGFAPSGVASDWRNNGTIPVSVLDAGITTTGSGWADTFRSGISVASLVEEAQFSQRHDAITMTVSRLTLQPGKTLAADALPGIEMLWVDSGNMVAVDATSAGTAAPFAFDKGSKLQGSFRPGRVFRSADNSPVTMLVMTITPAEMAKPPT